MEFGYSYSGSLGVVLLAPGERSLLEGKFDQAIDALFQVMDIKDRSDVRDVGKRLGNAVVKRMHDWSKANIEGGFAADVRWNRSDGRQLGEVIERRRMEAIVDIIGATSDEQREERQVGGILIGGDLMSRTFHFVVPHGPEFRGSVADSFSPDTMVLGDYYLARILETKTTVYSTDKVESKFELLSLSHALSSFLSGQTG